MSSYLALHRATLTVPVMSPPPRWALTPPFHPYLSRGDQMGSRRVGHRRFDFCGAGVGLLRLGITQRPARGVRTFLPMPKHRATIQSSTHAKLVYGMMRVRNKQPDQSLLQLATNGENLYLPPISGRGAAGKGALF